MIWGPFLLALALGLIVSAGLYFAYLWPSVEPEDEDSAPPATARPAVDPPAASEPEAAAPATEPETEAPAPASESSPA